MGSKLSKAKNQIKETINKGATKACIIPEINKLEDPITNKQFNSILNKCNTIAPVTPVTPVTTVTTVTVPVEAFTLNEIYVSTKANILYIIILVIAIVLGIYYYKTRN